VIETYLCSTTLHIYVSKKLRRIRHWALLGGGKKRKDLQPSTSEEIKSVFSPFFFYLSLNAS